MNKEFLVFGMAGKKFLFLLFFFTCSSLFAYSPGDFVTAGPTHKKQIALTFDDGPGPDTEKFLDLFDKTNTKVTFFVLGELAGYHPQVLKRMLASGHDVADHTFNHRNYKAYQKQLVGKLGSDEAATAQAKKDLRDDMARSNKNIVKATGKPVTYCRMPNGIDRPWIKQVAKEQGYILVNWTYGSDWTKLEEAQMLKEYASAIKPGAILLFHDGGKNRSKTLHVTEEIIRIAKEKGYELVTVGQLLKK